MTIKNDLKDIGYILITPNPKKFRYEGVNYPRAAKQLMFGALTAQFLLVGTVFFGPVILNKLDDLKESVKKKLKK